MTEIIIAIATSGRDLLLNRTLESLSNCLIPDNLKSIIVVENGTRMRAEEIVKKYSNQIPVSYTYIPDKGKNYALNDVSYKNPHAFILFFDDDVQIERGTLKAYDEAVQKLGRKMFLGGRCRAEYETPPPSWIKPYLPYSAKGWCKGDTLCRLTVPEALGFNWGAYSEDIINCGGFNVTRGPGAAHSIGDETEMQECLLHQDIVGYYIPEALVWHYIPAERCSPEWVISRARQQGIARGLRHSLQPLPAQLRLAGICLFRVIMYGICTVLLEPMMDAQRGFRIKRNRSRHLGVLQGIAIRKKILRKGREP